MHKGCRTKPPKARKTFKLTQKQMLVIKRKTNKNAEVALCDTHSHPCRPNPPPPILLLSLPPLPRCPATLFLCQRSWEVPWTLQKAGGLVWVSLCWAAIPYLFKAKSI